MKTLRSTISAILDKVSSLLQSEPARLIGYGSAVVIYFAANYLASKGIGVFVPMTVEESITASVAGLAILVGIVESIRRFVYSPLTYIEDLADETKAAHEQAHAEEEFNRTLRAMVAQAEEAAKPKRTRVAVGTVKARDADKDLSN